MTTVSNSRGLVALVLVAGFAPAPAHAYRTLAEVEGSATPIVWVEAPTVALDITGLSADQQTLFQQELTASIETWDAVDCAEVLLTSGGTDAATAAVVVRIVANWTEQGFEATAAGTTDLVFVSTPDGGAEIVNATLSLNGTFEWGAHPQDGGTVRDLRAVLVHELGHVLGLEHSQDARATMAATYAGSSQADLADDDVAGICSLYAIPPPPPPACEVEEQCEPGHWCIEGECRPDLRFGAECSDGSECIGARCVEVETGAGACTYVCESNDECPSSTSCLPVEGRTMERVCAPAAPAAGCSVSVRGEPMPFSLLVLMIVAASPLGRRRRCQVRRPPLAGEGRGGGALRTILVLVSALAWSACNTTHEQTDAGADAGPADAGELDAGADLPDATAPPDTGPVPVCEPGEMRVATCGFCGMEGQTCDAAGQWMATSECLGQGECAVGSVETRDLEMCAQEQRLCLDGCAWGEWEMSRGPGVCRPGETRNSGDACGPGETRDETCSGACEWTGTTPCTNPCGLVPRTTPDWAREVCVPAGNFYRGSLTYDDTQPIAEIYVSSFLLDAFPVTNRRYRDCVTAGACTPSSHPTYSMTERLDYPVQQMTRAQAIQFCTWDGGRRLPTEAEWEKAGRGPSPRMNPFPWEGTAWDCGLVVNPTCPGYVFPPTDRREWAADPYDGLPGTRSYYGTYLQVAGVGELVADYYHEDWYSSPRSMVPDPLAGPEDSYPGELWQTSRGNLRRTASPELSHRGYRNVTFGETADEYVGFRCARSAP